MTPRCVFLPNIYQEMNFSELQHLRRFVTRLRLFKLSKVDQNKLKTWVQSTHKDSELHALMHDHWQQLAEESNSLKSPERLEVLRDRILHQISEHESVVKTGKHRFFSMGWITRVAAVLLLTLSIGSVFLIKEFRSTIARLESANASHTIETNPGLRSHLILPDSTEVWLNSGSSLQFNTNLVTAATRRVKVIGEAYFKVSHDSQRPFFVETNHVTISVLGTSFNVSAYADDQKITTTLTEGSVLLLDRSENEIGRLQPGQAAEYSTSNNMLAMYDVDPEDAMSWTTGKLVFRNTSLQEVAVKLQRWFNQKITIDPSLAQEELSFTGTIEYESLPQVLRLIEIATHVKSKTKESEVILSR